MPEWKLQINVFQSTNEVMDARRSSQTDIINPKASLDFTRSQNETRISNLIQLDFPMLTKFQAVMQLT